MLYFFKCYLGFKAKNVRSLTLSRLSREENTWKNISIWTHARMQTKACLALFILLEYPAYILLYRTMKSQPTNIYISVHLVVTLISPTQLYYGTRLDLGVRGEGGGGGEALMKIESLTQSSPIASNWVHHHEISLDRLAEGKNENANGIHHVLCRMWKAVSTAGRKRSVLNVN